MTPRREPDALQGVIAIEAEKYAPSLELAFRLARCLGAPFEDVFSYAEP